MVDRFHSKVELIVALALVACAALNAAVPYSSYIELLFTIYVLEGWMEALVNIGKVTQFLFQTTECSR